jgi:hypothetical protein
MRWTWTQEWKNSDTDLNECKDANGEAKAQTYISLAPMVTMFLLGEPAIYNSLS